MHAIISFALFFSSRYKQQKQEWILKKKYIWCRKRTIFIICHCLMYFFFLFFIISIFWFSMSARVRARVHIFLCALLVSLALFMIIFVFFPICITILNVHKSHLIMSLFCDFSLLALAAAAAAAPAMIAWFSRAHKGNLLWTGVAYRIVSQWKTSKREIDHFFFSLVLFCFVCLFLVDKNTAIK